MLGFDDKLTCTDVALSFSPGVSVKYEVHFLHGYAFSSVGFLWDRKVYSSRSIKHTVVS
jgi:hypothetical protein